MSELKRSLFSTVFRAINSVTIEGVASSNTLDRMGDILEPSGMRKVGARGVRFWRSTNPTCRSPAPISGSPATRSWRASRFRLRERPKRRMNIEDWQKPASWILCLLVSFLIDLNPCQGVAFVVSIGSASNCL